MSGEAQIKTRCPVCSTKYRLPARSAGHRARCGKCKTTFRVAAIREGHPPTEEDVLRWLNEGMDEDEIAARPRVISGDAPMAPSGAGDHDHQEPEPGPARLAGRQPVLKHDAPIDPDPVLTEGKSYLRKTG